MIFSKIAMVIITMVEMNAIPPISISTKANEERNDKKKKFIVYIKKGN